MSPADGLYVSGTLRGGLSNENETQFRGLDFSNRSRQCSIRFSSAFRRSKAATYNVDPFSGGVPGTGGYVATTIYGYYPAGYYVTHLYLFEPGDTVNFGTLDLYPTDIFFPPDPGPNHLAMDAWFTDQYVVSFNGTPLSVSPIFSFFCYEGAPATNPYQCQSHSPDFLTKIIHLVITLPADATSIQVAWTTPFAFDAVIEPIPNPLPLFAADLGVLTFLAWRRNRKVQSTT